MKKYNVYKLVNKVKNEFTINSDVYVITYQDFSFEVVISITKNTSYPKNFDISFFDKKTGYFLATIFNQSLDKKTIKNAETLNKLIYSTIDEYFKRYYVTKNFETFYLNDLKKFV